MVNMAKRTAKSSQTWITQTLFKGMNSLFRSTILKEGTAADCLNADLGSSSQAAPILGYSSFGNQPNVSQNVVRKFTYTKQDGTEIMVQVRDNATNYIVEYLNPLDTRNDANGQWSLLEIGLTRLQNNLDGTTRPADFGFTSFNNSSNDRLIYGNAVEGLRIWNGAIAKIASTTSGTVVVTGTRTLAQLGFGATTSIVINGNTYAVSSISGQTFNVNSNPTAEPVGSGITQVVDSSTLSGKDYGSILISSQARIFMAGMTTTPNQVDFCDIADPTSWAGANPSNGGFEDFPQMNGRITALSSLLDWVIVFSAKKIIAFKFAFPTSTTRTTIRVDIDDEGCPNQKAVRKIGNQVWYVTPKGGIKSIIQVETQDTFQVKDMTEPIRPTINDFVWTDACLEYLTTKKVLIAAGRSNSTVTVNDMAIGIFFTLDQDGQVSYNHTMIDWFISDMCILGNNIHFASSVDSRDYLAFDGYTKNGADHRWRRTERVELFDNGFNKKLVRYIGLRGAIGVGTTLKITAKYGLNGAISQSVMELKGNDTRFVNQTALNSLGGFTLGSEPLGGTVENIGDLLPFKVKFPLPMIYIEDFQLTYETNGQAQRVFVDTLGYSVQDAEQHNTSDEMKELGSSQ